MINHIIDDSRNTVLMRTTNTLNNSNPTKSVSLLKDKGVVVVRLRGRRCYLCPTPLSLRLSKCIPHAATRQQRQEKQDKEAKPRHKIMKTSEDFEYCFYGHNMEE